MNKGKFSFGAIRRFFTRMTNLIYYVISVSFIGKLFCAYPASERAIQGSYVGNIGRTGKKSRGGRRRYTARRAVACAMERNVLSRVTGWMLRTLSRCSLRTLGMFFVSFSTYSALMYLLAATAWHNNAATWGNLIAAACVFPAGLLLLFSDQSLGYALQNSGLGVILDNVFGLADDGVQAVEIKGQQRYFIAVLIGALTGAIGMLIQPWLLLCIIVATFVGIMVLSVPETGVMLFLLSVPFIGFIPYGTYLLLILAGLFLIGYTAKLLRGNRVFRLDAQDIPVLVLAIFFGFSGFSVAGGDAPIRAFVQVCLILAYFPVMNIIATTKWLTRCRIALSLTAVTASIVGILQFVLGAVSLAKTSEIDMEVLGDYVTAGFVDHTTFVYFLVIAFAFTFPCIFTARKGFRPFIAAACVLMASAVALAWVQSAWIALALIAAIFALVYEKRSFPFLLFGSGAAVGAYFLLPDRIRVAVSTFLKETSGKALSRSAVTNAVFEIFFGENRLVGSSNVLRFLFGLGNGGLEALYPIFGAAGTEFTEGACSLWLTLLCEFGVVGAAVPALLFFALLQNSFSALRNAQYREKPVIAYVGICLAASTLFLSFFRSAWYDPAALAFFFTAIALVGAGLRFDRRNHIRYTDMVTQPFSSAEIEYRG